MNILDEDNGGTIEKEEFVKLFQVSIQFGAILAVVVLYWKKFFDFSKLQFFIKLACAVVPALILGKLFDDKIEAVLEHPTPIAIVLIIGGIILLFVDRFFQNPTIHKEEDITIKKAVTIGFWQCLAMMPGTSRSAASIIGGMQQGLSRQASAEFSFFLAVPTMLAASAKSTLDVYQESPEIFTTNNLYTLLIGGVVAFLVALISVKFFIGFIQKKGFALFGWYRIILGLAIMACLYTNLI